MLGDDSSSLGLSVATACHRVTDPRSLCKTARSEVVVSALLGGMLLTVSEVVAVVEGSWC